MSTSKKRGLIIGIIIAIAVIAIGAFILKQNSNKELETKEITVTLDSKNQAQDSSPVVVIFKDDKGKDVYATAVRLDAKTAKVNVPITVKKVEVVSAVNSDGSLEKQDREASVKDDTFTVTLKTVPKEKVSAKDYEKIIKAVTDAAKIGDSTLSKDNVKDIIEIVNNNIKNNSKLDKKEAKELDKKADEAKDESVKNASENEESRKQESKASAPAKKEAKGKTWVPEKGHYETKTTTTYETKAVTGEGHYERKLVRMKYTCRDGFTSYDRDEIIKHGTEALRKATVGPDGIANTGGADTYVYEPEYEDVWVPGETTYQKVPVTKTTKVWVVDEPGHYE